MEITLKVEEQKLLTDLQLLAAKLKDRKPLLHRIGTRLQSEIELTFRNSGNSQDPIWPHLAPSTAYKKATEGRSEKPLISTGRLRGSFTFEADNDKVIVGTVISDKWVAVHEYGGRGAYTIKPKTKKLLAFVSNASNLATGSNMIFAREVNHPAMPQRKMLPTNARALELAVKIAEDYIKGMA